MKNQRKVNRTYGKYIKTEKNKKQKKRYKTLLKKKEK